MSGVPAPAGLEKAIASELMTSDGWRYRRALIFSVVLFLCALISFLCWRDSASALTALVTQSAFSTIMLLVPAYVFGALWDDRNKRSYAALKGSLSPVAPSSAPSPSEQEDPAQ